MNKQFSDFSEVMGQFLPVAEQMQQQMQSQMQQVMGAFGGLPGMQGVAPINPVTMGALAPFMHSVMGAFQQTLSQISVHALGQIQSEYAAELSSLLASAFSSMPSVDGKPAKPASMDAYLDGDKRFAAPDWRDHGVYEFTAALYSLNAKFTRKIVDLVPNESPEKRRMEYAVEQLVDALSPSNFFVTNPEAQKKLLETKGESLTQAIQNLLADMQKGRISQTDESAFEVGVNVATTAGQVVYENEYFQLIQYTSTTEKVGKQPMLFVPPCINKYYILDLQPANSLVKFVVDQGHTLFLVSWKNPTEAESHFSWDGYVENGVIQAIEVVKSISKQPKLNVLGFCVGGTLLATALSTLANRGDESINSVTFLTTLLDFTDTGALGVFVSEEQVRAREDSIGQGGLMPGKDLSGAFSSLRPNDLIWNYVVSNYLKGEKPPVFDLLYWNSDSTNLAGPMFAWYLRNAYLENRLVKPGSATVCGEPVDLGLIDVPVYVLATREDHIVPWTSAFQTSHLVSGDARFVLGASGHIAGVINPASKNKRNYWVCEGNIPDNPEGWLKKAKEVPGSWWNDWAAWLEPLKGGEVKAPAKLGSPKFKPIEPAPGRYVKQRV
ncbi:MAG TPA: class I poly(R)-hydroxyalkanoic acid synthase [Limnobacter sp.]|nr:class I poly(R)-hydroxyalkanoic acid synthase [Limnobacter sp.]